MTLSDDMERVAQELLVAYDQRMAGVANIREVTAEELAEFGAARREMAAAQRRCLAEAHASLISETADTLSSLEKAHQEMATEQRRRLAESRARLVSETGAMLVGFGKAHREMAAEERRRLAESHARLASDGAALRGELQQELSQARTIWTNLAALMRQRRAGTPIIPPSPPTRPTPPPAKEATPPAAVEAPPEVRKEEIVGDDLTVIRGIGPGMRTRLNRAGIHTYAELAARTPEEMRQLLGEAGRMASVEEWIEQARQLAGAA